MNDSKSVLQAVIGMLPDDKIMKMLEVIGLKPGMGSDPVMDGMSAEENNKIKPWNDVTIDFGGSGEGRPPLVDKNWLIKAKAKNAAESDPGQIMSPGTGGDTNPFLQSGGGT